MGTEAYKRVSWGKSKFSGEEIELADISETSGITVGEGLETTALLGEEVEALASIETVAAGLDATGVGLPIGLLVGGLALAGFGAYEIYEYAKSTNKYPKLTEKNVNRHYNKAKKLTARNYKPIEELPDPEKDKLDIETLEKQGFVPPPYKYLGPGNTLNRGEPYNNIDSDAKIHDIQYSSANTKEDVFKSDKEFLQKSGDHIIEGISGQGSYSDTIGAIIGGTGIGIKHSVEKLTNNIHYPNLGELCRRLSEEIIILKLQKRNQIHFLIKYINELLRKELNL